MKTSIVSVLTILLFMAFACQECPEKAQLEELKAQAQMEELNRKVAPRYHYDLAVDKKYDLAKEILAEDVIIHSPGMEDLKGRDAVMATLSSMWDAMPDAKIIHYEEIVEDNYVFIRWSMEFNNTVDLMGIPATGKKIENIGGMDLFLMENGKIKELWQYYDQLSFMTQLGALPTHE